MKASESRDYNREFPEQFTWGHIDSPQLSSIAAQIRNRIEHSFAHDPDRVLIPGLRAALNDIADVAKL